MLPKIFTSVFERIGQNGNKLMYSALILIIIPFVGAVGYSSIEGWTFFDGYYMAVITLTTIGYQEVNTLSDAGRVFTIAYIVIGVGSVAYAVSSVVETVINPDIINQRLRYQKIRSMNHHYIVCGYGRYGKRVVEQLLKLDKAVIVIEKIPEKLEALRKQGITFVQGDATDEQVLLKARVKYAAGLITTLDHDAANVFAVLTARGLNKYLHIVSRAEMVTTEKKLKIAGANAVLSPYNVGAVRMTHMLLQERLLDSFDIVTNSVSIGITVEEFTITEEHAICKQPISSLTIRQDFDANVLAIKMLDDSVQFPPSASTVLDAGMTLIVAVKEDHISGLRRFFQV